MHFSSNAPRLATSSRQAEATPPAGLVQRDGQLAVLEFACGGQRFALPVEKVRRALRSALPVPLPEAPDIVLGILNVGGEIVSVLDFALRAIGVPTLLTPAHQFILADVAGFPCALVVDAIDGTALLPQPTGGWPAETGIDFVVGACRLPDGLCLVIDPARFLFPDEQTQLAQALERDADARC